MRLNFPQVHTTLSSDIIPLQGWERNGYNDSDFFLSFYDMERNEIRFALVDTTRAAGGYMSPTKGRELPLTADNWPAVRDALRRMIINQLTKLAEADARYPRPGCKCRVTAGRKVKPGTVVECIGKAVHRGKYCYGAKDVTSILVRIPGGSMVHVDIDYLEVLNPESIDVAAIAARADAILNAGQIDLTGTWPSSGQDWLGGYLASKR